MQTVTDKTEQPHEPKIFTKRIGSTNYKVTVYFSNTSYETINDKVIRLIKNDVSRKAAG